MDDLKQPGRVTIRLTPFQARAVMKLRTYGLTEGQRARTVTAVLVEAALKAAKDLPESTDQTQAASTTNAAPDVPAEVVA